MSDAPSWLTEENVNTASKVIYVAATLSLQKLIFSCLYDFLPGGEKSCSSKSSEKSC
jgi:hypothetical protein